MNWISDIWTEFIWFSEGDICALALETPCDNSRGGVNWYYDSREGVCKEVPEGGCNKNRNNFQSREQCEGYCSRESKYT